MSIILFFKQEIVSLDLEEKSIFQKIYGFYLGFGKSMINGYEWSIINTQFIKMSQNCIDVKYVQNLSIPYLTRFFSSAGPIEKVEKNENSKYVTILFVNKYSVEKALRFNGRVLDKEPIKIKKHPSQHSAVKSNTVSSQSLQLRSHSLIERFDLPPVHSLSSKLWELVVREVKLIEWSEQQKLLLALTLWRMGLLLIEGGLLLAECKVNLRGQYLLFTLQQEIVDRLQKQVGEIGMEGTSLEITEGKALMWYTVAYSNIEEEQSKVQAYSLHSKCIQKLATFSPSLAETFRSLHACSLVFNPEEASCQDLFANPANTIYSQDDLFQGIVENIGARDIFYDFLSYEHANSCITLTSGHEPMNFECTLRLVGCPQSCLEEKVWCDLFQAVVWRRKKSNNKDALRIETKRTVEKLSLSQHSICFQESQFGLERLCSQSKKYHSLHLSEHIRIFYIRRQPHIEKGAVFQKLYEDEDFNIEDQVQPEHAPIQFQEEVVLNLYLIDIKGANNILSQLKLQHYLASYIEESILSKGLIIASQQMALKLAGNLIEREKEGRLFEYAHPRFQRLIGDQLWRLYSSSHQRRLKHSLARWQSGRK